MENIPEAAAQAVDIPGAASQYVPQGDYPGRANKDRLQEMRAQGFGENSFVNKNSPYRNRVNGVTARGQAATENMDNQKNYDLRNKKCLKCQKKFLNGILKKSKVIQCNGCGGFVHEKSSTGCKVNLSRGSLQFYCSSCANFAVTVREDAVNINNAEFEMEDNRVEDVMEVVNEDIISENVTEAQEEENVIDDLAIATSQQDHSIVNGTINDVSMMMSQSCMRHISLNDSPTAPLAESSMIEDVEHDVIAKDLEVESEESYLASEKGPKELVTEDLEAEEEAETSEIILNKSDSNMNNTKETVPDEEYNEDNMDTPEDSFRLILEDTPVQEDTVVEEYCLLNKYGKRKRDILHITISIEAPTINDVKGLASRKMKCTRMRGYNINFKPNK